MKKTTDFVKNRRIRNLELDKVLSNAQKAFGEAKYRLMKQINWLSYRLWNLRHNHLLKMAICKTELPKYQEASRLYPKKQTKQPLNLQKLWEEFRRPRLRQLQLLEQVIRKEKKSKT